MPRRGEQRDRLRAVKEDEPAIHSYPDRFLTCRDFRHAWELVGYWHEGGRINRRLACIRCGMERHDTWSPSGLSTSRSYDAPDNYYWTGEKLRGVDIRHEVMRRAKVYETADDMLAAVR